MADDLERLLATAFASDMPRRDFLKLGASSAGLLALAACGGSAAPSSQSSAATGPEFKIGVVLPSSGTYSDLGDSITKGMKLYFDKVGNQAGGRKITMLLEDESAGDTNIPLTKTRKLVEQDNVDMIAGIVASPNAAAIRNYVDQNKVPTLIANAGLNALSRASKSQYIFRTSFSNWQPSQPMGKVLNDAGVKNLTLVYSNYGAGIETAAAIKEVYSGKIAAEVKPPFPNTSGDFSPFITQINNSKPDAIYVFMSGQDAINFLKQAKTQMDKSIKVYGSGFFVEQDVLGAIGDAAPVGAITGLHWALTLDNKENQDFTSGFKKAFNKTADVFAVQGYDTARVIVETLNSLKGKTDDKTAFMSAVARASFKSPRGDFKFDTNSNNVVNTIYVRQLVNDPKLGYTNKVTRKVSPDRDASLTR
jgi:branched-chain amino acid transport system substrate-binding protein